MTSDLARALVVLAEALVTGKRVLVIGDSSLALHELLTEMGARLVHVYDPDESRALAQTPPHARGTVLRGMPEGDFDVRDGAFDLAIVPDLAAMSDAAALLARLRRVVGAEGAVLCAALNRDGRDAEDAKGSTLDYYELYDLVSLQFASVRMIAAMPFVGVTLAELGQDEVDSAVRVDAQLVTERPPPSAFLALASQADVALDAYAVIETGAPATVAAPRDDSHAAELAQARLRADALAAQVDELAHARSARVRAEEETRRAMEALDVERERSARLERELDAARRHAAVDTTAEIAGELAQTQIRAAALEEGVALAEKTIVVQRERIAELEAELVAIPPPAPPPPPPPPEPETDDARELEAKLRERGEHVAELEGELARREKLVKELVARLGEGEVDPTLAAKLDELALLAAHQRSELEARAWRIAELERAASKNAPPKDELKNATS